MPPDVPEFFIPRREQLDAGAALLYRPAVLGVARLHYADKKTGMDHWETLGLLRPVVEELPADVWDGAEAHTDHVPELNKTPEPGARFGPLPAALARAKSYAEYTKGLKNYLYRERKLTVWSCPDLKAYSRPGESQRDFRLRLSQGSREARDRANEELRAKYASKRNKLQEDIRKARETSGPRTSPGEQGQVGRRRCVWQLGTWGVSRQKDDQQDKCGQGHVRRQGSRQGHAAKRRSWYSPGRA